MRNLLYRLTVEDLIALMLVAKVEDGDIDGDIVDVCTKRDIYCDVEYLARLRLIKKVENGYVLTKKGRRFLRLVYELASTK